MMRSRLGYLAAALGLALSAACSSSGNGHPRVVADPDLAYRGEPRELAVDQQAKQALSRLTFGPRPGEYNQVLHEGLDNWLLRQLTPENNPDPAVDTLLAGAPDLLRTVRDLEDSFPQQDIFVRRQRLALGLAANAQYTLTHDDSVRLKAVTDAGNRVVQRYMSARLQRSVISDHQLLEVMTVFWENHFSVFRGKMPTQFTLLEYDRDVIRPHALGKFRDLLGAVAHSSAMLYYLDNYQSTVDSTHLPLALYNALSNVATARDSQRILATYAKRRGGLNENYGRELLELHTLGVDGGYTQGDVINVARALTGWGIDTPREGGEFRFQGSVHDADAKLVLGHALPAGRGLEDGNDVLDIVARHPSTARFIAKKLVRYFVADSAPPALVERAAETFTRTDGDIRQVLAVIASSPEFYARAAVHAKVKTPFELVASTYRALGAFPDSTNVSVNLLNQLGQQLYGRLTPDGWPDDAGSWMNTGSVLARINFGANVAAGRVRNISVAKWPLAAALRGTPLREQIDAISGALFQGEMSADTHRVLESGSNPLAEQAAVSGKGVPSLADIIGLALGAPEFQRR